MLNLRIAAAAWLGLSALAAYVWARSNLGADR